MQAIYLVKNGKPNPEIFLLAAERLKLDASKCIVVEDAIFGCVAGRKASCKVIACVEKKFEKYYQEESIDFKSVSDLQITSLKEFPFDLL